MKIGRLTAALILLATGALLLLQQLTDVSLISYLGDWWPVAIIALGLEWLIFAAVPRKDGQGARKLDVGGLAVAVILAMFVYGYHQSKDGFKVPDWISAFTSISSESSDPVRQWTETLELPGGVGEIVLTNQVGSVTVRTGDVADIQVESTVYMDQYKKEDAGAAAEEVQLTSEQDGDRLLLNVSAPSYKSTFFAIHRKPRVNLSITVPQELRADWDVTLVNGTIDASGLALAGQFQAESINGSIKLAEMQGAVLGETKNGSISLGGIKGKTTAETANGKVTIERIEGDLNAKSSNGEIRVDGVTGSATLRTNNGKIQVYEVSGKLEARTNNGSVTVDSAVVGGEWKLKTDNGSVDLRLPRDGSFRVEGDTRHEPDSDLGLQARRGSLSGSVGGGKYLIQIDTNGHLTAMGRD